MILKKPSTILLIGNDATLSYLLARFAQHSGYQWKVCMEKVSSHEIAALNPAVIIFLSTDWLAREQLFVTELTDLDTPIMVCSSPVEEARARELGADYCLFHPLTLGDFQTALVTATSSKGV